MDHLRPRCKSALVRSGEKTSVERGTNLFRRWDSTQLYVQPPIVDCDTSEFMFQAAIPVSSVAVINRWGFDHRHAWR
jgi:hypothetical protein